MLLKALRLPGKKSLAKASNTPSSFFSGYIMRSRLCVFLVAWMMVREEDFRSSTPRAFWWLRSFINDVHKKIVNFLTPPSSIPQARNRPNSSCFLSLVDSGYPNLSPNTPFLTLSTLRAFSRFFSLQIFVSFQPAITCSKLTIETLEQGVKYVQSYQ